MANSLAHTKWVCKYHIVFTPKYRRKIIYKELRKDIQQRRKKNFEILDANLSSINLMQVSNYGGCYMYPLLQKNGHRIKQELIQQKIYVPTLWPNVLEETTPDTWEYFLTDNLVLLPIDQRYSETDMKYILKVLTQILGGEADAY